MAWGKVKNLKFRSKLGGNVLKNMSYALSTSKRKLHRILDSVSDSSNISVSLPNSEQTTSKVNLLAQYESPAKKKARLSHSGKGSTKPVDLFIQSRFMPISASSTPTSDVKKPHFVPWDRKAFLERLETFQDVGKWMWVWKPEPINDVPWAKRGWRAVEKDTVGCEGCAAEVTIVMPEAEPDGATEGTDMSAAELRDWQKAVEKQLVEKYEGMIVTGHQEGCPWREKGCDATIHRMPLAHPSTALEALRQRYDSLIKMAAKLPHELKVPDGLDIDGLPSQFSILVRTLKKNPASNFSAQSPPAKALTSLAESPYRTAIVPNTPTGPRLAGGQTLSEGAQTPSAREGSIPVEGESTQAYQSIDTKALTLAIFGWQAETEHPSNLHGIITCKACFRRNMLSSYGEREDGAIPFNPADHRRYCPWINAATQNGEKALEGSGAGLAGWQSLVSVIDMAHASKIRRGQDSFAPSADSIQPIRTPNQEMPHDVEGSNEVSSIMSMDGAHDDAELEKRDKDLRARFKKLKRVFTVKRSKSTGKENSAMKRTKSVA